MNNTDFTPINPAALPGIRIDQWKNMSAPRDSLAPFNQWEQLSPREKALIENKTVREYFSEKSADYSLEISEHAAALPDMPGTQRIGIVIPAYNEQDSIGTTLEVLVKQVSQPENSSLNETLGIMVVVNRPLREDAQRDAAEQKNLAATVNIIKTFQENYPQVDLNFIVAEVPANKAGVGLARMLGHDVLAFRSLMRPESERVAPYYIQTMDADMPALNPQYLTLLLSTLERDNYSRDFYREAGRFPVSELRKYPLLDAMDFMWTDTLRQIAENSDSSWTAGAGILVSLHAHANAGGVFPFRLSKGVDEDLRIGIHARLSRGSGDFRGQGQINESLFEIDPRRVVLVIGDLLETLSERGILHTRAPLTRDVHDIATLLKSYLDFHNTEIRGQNSPVHTDVDWLQTKEAFEHAVPTATLEAIANSYRELIRVELSLDKAKHIAPYAGNIYNLFADGKLTYPVMRGTYNRFEQLFAAGSFKSLSDSDRGALEEIFTHASQQATELMATVLRGRGIACDVLAIDHTPPGKEPQDVLPSPILITSTDEYRQRLLELLG